MLHNTWAKKPYSDFGIPSRNLAILGIIVHALNTTGDCVTKVGGEVTGVTAMPRTECWNGRGYVTME